MTALEMLGKRVRYKHRNGTVGIVVSTHPGCPDVIYVAAPGFGTIPGRMGEWELETTLPVSDARSRREQGKPWTCELWDGHKKMGEMTVTDFRWVLGGVSHVQRDQ